MAGSRSRVMSGRVLVLAYTATVAIALQSQVAEINRNDMFAGCLPATPCSMECEAQLRNTFRDNFPQYVTARETFETQNAACRNQEFTPADGGSTRRCDGGLDAWKAACLARTSGPADQLQARGLVCEIDIRFIIGGVGYNYVDQPCIYSTCFSPRDIAAISPLLAAEFCRNQPTFEDCTGTINCLDNEDFRFGGTGSAVTGPAPRVDIRSLWNCSLTMIALLVASTM